MEEASSSAVPSPSSGLPSSSGSAVLETGELPRSVPPDKAYDRINATIVESLRACML